MTKSVVYACPKCSGQFSYLHHPNPEQDPAPRFCPLCGFDTQADESSGLAPAITAPALMSARTRSIDGHMTAMEESSYQHAAATGEPSLKMTDMRTNLREGDITAMPVNNDISRMIDANPGRFGFQGGQQQAVEYSQTAHTGYAPNAGVRALNALRSGHAASGGVTTSLPALETQQPGYRSRVR